MMAENSSLSKVEANRKIALSSTGPKTAEGKAVSRPTEEERVAVRAVLARRKETPSIKISEKGGRAQLSLDHRDQVHGQALLMDAFATGDVAFYRELLTQLANAGSYGEGVDERGINFMVAVIKGIEPKDQLETMLAAQMAAVHMLTMSFARRLGASDTFQELDSVERIFNKLARTFAGQMETLKRYRTGGEQKVTVEHVTVNQGGQAIVGNVAHRGEGPSKKPETTS